MLARTTITTLALAIAGGGLWTLSGTMLSETKGFDYQPNPLGIKRSPYGQVLAMAIQTPIDADWHGGMEIHDHDHDHDHGHDGGCDHHHDCDHDHDAEHIAEHDHSDHHCEGCDHEHDHDHSTAPTTPAKKASLLTRLEKTVTKRTNPNPPTQGHQIYLRQEIEKKLRFAYDLDPSHYANYNCYHLFITQRQLGTHGLPDEEVSKMIETLADYTIRFCLAEQEDPRPALTASSAAYNVLERMLTVENGTYTIEQMRQQLGTMEFCLQRHFALLDQFIENGSFALLSGMRQEEILTRSKFAIKLRDSAQEAINRRENPETSTADAS